MEPAFPALPISRDFNGELLYQAKGLTIRDYFAAKALFFCLQKSWGDDDAAQRAYRIADEMMEARNVAQ